VRTRTFRVAAGIALCVIGLGAAVVGAVAGFVVVGTDDVVTVRPKEFTAKGLAIVTGPDLIDYYGNRAVVTVEPIGERRDVFVGVGHRIDVRSYLGAAQRTELTEISYPSTVQSREVRGNPARVTPPAQLDWWLASESGRGTQTLRWTLADGPYDIVVMAADGRPGVDVRVRFGLELPGAFRSAMLVLLAGVGMLAAGGLLVRTRAKDELDEDELEWEGREFWEQSEFWSHPRRTTAHQDSPRGARKGRRAASRAVPHPPSPPPGSDEESAEPPWVAWQRTESTPPMTAPPAHASEPSQQHAQSSPGAGEQPPPAWPQQFSPQHGSPGSSPSPPGPPPTVSPSPARGSPRDRSPKEPPSRPAPPSWPPPPFPGSHGTPPAPPHDSRQRRTNHAPGVTPPGPPHGTRPQPWGAPGGQQHGAPPGPPPAQPPRHVRSPASGQPHVQHAAPVPPDLADWPSSPEPVQAGPASPPPQWPSDGRHSHAAGPTDAVPSNGAASWQSRRSASPPPDALWDDVPAVRDGMTHFVGSGPSVHDDTISDRPPAAPRHLDWTADERARPAGDLSDEKASPEPWNGWPPEQTGDPGGRHA